MGKLVLGTVECAWAFHHFAAPDGHKGVECQRGWARNKSEKESISADVADERR
jgi:hypothetical protein